VHFSLEPAARMGRPQQHNSFLRTYCYSNALNLTKVKRPSIRYTFTRSRTWHPCIFETTGKTLPCYLEEINKTRIISIHSRGIR
jgi:hypothetical protein